jgi:hypothetical protein
MSLSDLNGVPESDTLGNVLNATEMMAGEIFILTYGSPEAPDSTRLKRASGQNLEDTISEYRERLKDVNSLLVKITSKLQSTIKQV